MRLPLHIKDGWLGYSLVDADGVTIATAQVHSWFGAREECRPEVVWDNLSRIAEAMNAAASSGASLVLRRGQI